MRRVGRVEDLTPLVARTSRLIEMHDGGRQKPKAAVAVLLVVPAEEDLPKARPSSIDPNRSGNCACRDGDRRRALPSKRARKCFSEAWE
jgi:hypothetical protein